MTPARVCLLTDFGVADNYVGVMKGAILKSAPHAQIVDLSHGIPAQDIRAGAFQLLTAASHFPPETLFVAVVDPGVGSERKILFAEGGGMRFLAPDNGLLSWVFEKSKPSRVMAVTTSLFSSAQLSRTFHGRDIFAPVAAKLLSGVNPLEVAKPVDSWVRLPFPALEKTGTLWRAEVLYIDGYGNLVTNIPSDDLLAQGEHSKIWFEFGERKPTIRGLVQSYSEGEDGKLLAIAGSHGYIEISVRNGSAVRMLGLKAGSPVEVHLRL